MTATATTITGDVPASSIRLARALVHDAARRGVREEARIEALAGLPLPEDARR